MDLAALCDPGCETFCAQDVQRILGRPATPAEGCVFIPDATREEAALLNYHLLTASRVLAVLSRSCDAASLLATDFSPFLVRGGAFKVVARENGERAHEVEESLGEALHKRGLPVDLTKPSMTIVAWRQGASCVVGVDLSGRDLGKREYRAFHTRRSLRSTIVASALFAGEAVGRRIIDPYSIDGTVAIEAVLAATRTSPQLYKKEFAFMHMPFAADKDWSAFFLAEDSRRGSEASVRCFYPLVRLLKMGRANAKLAGIDKLLSQTKCELRWLSTKLVEHNTEVLITVPPVSSKHVPPKDVEQVQDELFAEAKRALMPAGRIVLIAEKKAELLNPAQRHGFELKKEWVVRRGGAQFFFLIFAAP
ncbi:hypothetical protein D6789_01125 [Candidatus Woesearchaeota archaeon]|nr:MAG: hypothetical protein D6789_01125 [Candidatus Woesearchaeota archaeon]